MDRLLEPRRVALITGGARGVGAATAQRLATEGWSVAIFDSCADNPALPYALATLNELDATVVSCGPNAIAVVGDVRSQDDLNKAVAQTVEQFGGLDAAVACAGAIAGGPPAWETTDEIWEALIDINLTGVWRLAKAAVPSLLARPEPRHGRFVAIASAAATTGMPQLAGYAAAKHGVLGFIRSLAAELGSMGVTANAICPGSTTTAMLAASAVVYGLESTEEFSRHHLLPRLITPDEVAAAAAWLCGRDADAITGAALPVDAGMTAS